MSKTYSIYNAQPYYTICLLETIKIIQNKIDFYLSLICKKKYLLQKMLFVNRWIMDIYNFINIAIIVPIGILNI